MKPTPLAPTVIGPWEQVCLLLAALKVLSGSVGFLIEPRHFEGVNPNPFPPLIFLLVTLSYGVVAGWLLFQSQGDRRAMHLGAVFLLVASCFSNVLIGQLHGLPAPVAARIAHVLDGLRPDAFLPYFFWLFVRDFPRAEVFSWRNRFLRMALRISALAGVVLFLMNVALYWLIAPIHPGESTRFQSFDSLYWAVLIVLTLPALGWMIWKARTAGAIEQRRARLFVAALGIGFGPVMVDVLLQSIIPAYYSFITIPANQVRIGIVWYSLLLSVPVVTAYSVLVHRVLDVRLLVRKTLQYALARYSVMFLAALPLLLLAAHAFNRRNESLALILSGSRPLVLLSTTMAGAAMLVFRRRIFSSLDRMFFRDQYDSRIILADLAEKCRACDSVDRLISFLSIEIDKALHLESVAVFISDPHKACLVSLNRRALPISTSAALVGMVENSVEPLEVELEDPTSQLHRLPQEELHWLVDGAYRLLVPLLASDGSLLGMVALGEKRSELPFSREDRLLLSAIAASGALTLENRLMRVSPRPPADRHSLGAAMEDASAGLCADDKSAMECSSCRKLHPPDSLSCSTCGGRLENAAVPYVLAGKFRLDRRVGAGGMGVVYRAVDLTLGRTVAVKTLPRISPEYSMRLRREARAMASTWHPNLALIFGAESWRGTPMLIFEFLSGGTLEDRLRSARLALQQAFHLGEVMADVLDRTHSAGILHRDIKPSNVGYSAEGIPKLLDFGLAHILYDTRREGPLGGSKRADLSSLPTVSLSGSQSAAPHGRLVGTPIYLSPEAVNDMPPDPSFDLWSVNIMLYESITGKRPMQRATLAETLQCIAKCEVPDIREALPSCPECVAQFFEEALARNPADRPRTARELRSRLQRLQFALPAGTLSDPFRHVPTASVV